MREGFWVALVLAACGGRADFGYQVRTAERGDVCGEDADPAYDEVECAEDLVCHPTLSVCMTWADVHATCCACVFEECGSGDAYNDDADACGASMDAGEPLIVGGACTVDDIGARVCVADCYLFTESP